MRVFSTAVAQAGLCLASPASTIVRDFGVRFGDINHKQPGGLLQVGADPAG